jgi:predicted nucleotidyltransferase
VPLPQLNESGDLPRGLHAATLDEVLERFGSGSRRRALLGGRLQRIWDLASSTGKVSRFVLFGSFVTSKPEPNDIDVFLLMDDSFDVKRTTGETRLVFEHGSAQDRLGASVFWLRKMSALDGEEAAINQWASKRDGTQRGIIELIPRQT